MISQECKIGETWETQSGNIVLILDNTGDGEMLFIDKYFPEDGWQNCEIWSRLKEKKSDNPDYFIKHYGE